ncbi:MAG TPA: cytochrome C oxidase subunit IV family protein [Longilinea sp.]|nr:cytochrome C oxidase subunit IV family protein [Longilinea sp.]
MDTRKTTRKGLALRRGVIVFLALAVLTAVEFVAARSGVPSAILWIIAILKAALVINFFMHLSRLFQPDEGGH